jgi:hypothetical protein
MTDSLCRLSQVVGISIILSCFLDFTFLSFFFFLFSTAAAKRLSLSKEVANAPAFEDPDLCLLAPSYLSMASMVGFHCCSIQFGSFFVNDNNNDKN